MPRADEPVSIRFKASGLLHIIGRNGGRKLKKIWQELGVPPWRRDTTPLLFYGETLIAAAGIFVTCDGLAEEGAGVRLEWKEETSSSRNDAGLPGVAEFRGQRAFHGFIKIGIVKDDKRRIAAQFQRYLFDVFGALLH